MSISKKYQKKPIIIDAVQYNGSNSYEIIEFSEGNAKYQTHPVYDDVLSIKTLEGDLKISVGDYVIRGVKGEFYPCKSDIFEMTYIEVPTVVIKKNGKSDEIVFENSYIEIPKDESVSKGPEVRKFSV